MEHHRIISKLVDKALFGHYSKGVFVPHTIPDEEGTRTYKSHPDSEVVLAMANFVQSDEYLEDFVKQFNNPPDPTRDGLMYIDRDGKNKYKVRDIKISYPHGILKHNIEPPHPSMTDKELLAYLWPGAKMTSEKKNYFCRVWVDIGTSDKKYASDEEEGLHKELDDEEEDSNWKPLFDLPCMVGSNKCNYNIIRSYLNDDTEIIDPMDKKKTTTLGKRADYILNTLTKCELEVNDGYYICNGDLKSMAIVDRILYNTIYTIHSGKKDINSPFEGYLTEIRSLHQFYGMTYFKMFLNTDPNDKMRSHIYKKNTTFVNVAIDDIMPKMNVFDLATMMGYAVNGVKDGADRLREEILTLTGEDKDILRVLDITYDDRDFSDPEKWIISDYFTKHTTDNDEDVFRYVLPHCETEEADPFECKLRVLALMFVNLVLCSVGRMDLTDKKDFSYKRYSTGPYEYKEYMRVVLTRGSKALPETKLLELMKSNKIPASAYSRKGTEKVGLIEDLPKYNRGSMLDSVRTTKIPGGKEGGANKTKARRIHSSQWGTQCMANTPENANIGLNNALAETALITVELLSSEREKLMEIINEFNPAEDGHLLILDGIPLRRVDESLYDELLAERREGHINRSIGIAKHSMFTDILPVPVPVIIVRTSHGRPVIPVFIIMKDGVSQKSRILELNENDDFLSYPNSGEYTRFDYLLDNQYVEFIDAYELVYNTIIASWIYSVPDTERVQYTHAMIKPGHVFSQVTNCLSYLNHNPPFRGTYASIHTKQAIANPFKHEKDRYEHEVSYMKNHEYPIVTTDTARRLGMKIGVNLDFSSMSDYGNVDDGIHFSDSLEKEGKFVGKYYNILYFKGIPGEGSNKLYNYKLNEDKTAEYVDTKIAPNDPYYRGRMPDVNFSDSVIVPYGDPYMIEMDSEKFASIPKNRIMSMNTKYRKLLPKSFWTLYQLKDGELYVPHGFRREYILTYRDEKTKEEIEIIHNPESKIHTLPGKVLVNREIITGEGEKRQLKGRLGKTYYKFALVLLHQDKLKDYDTPFISKKPILEGSLWYGGAKSRVPRYYTMEDNEVVSKVVAQLMTIRPKREVKRMQVAIKVLRRDTKDKIIGVDKERFDVTYGTIEGIYRLGGVKIKTAMPLFPKVGNKYEAAHAQKSVAAKIKPKALMPKARWFNPVTGKEEQIVAETTFNPLSNPSRMTIGMMYETLITGTLKYLFSIPYNSTSTLKDLYVWDDEDPSYKSKRDILDKFMLDTYKVENASKLIDELSDSTMIIYDDMEKRRKCKELREALGIPPDGLYTTYVPDQDLYVENTINYINKLGFESDKIDEYFLDTYEIKDVSRIFDTTLDIEDRFGIASKIREKINEESIPYMPTKEEEIQIETPIFFGSVYYSALRHLVDNKRRARGYVGRKDPLTGQPVKGRRKEGGANTGRMEIDADEAHGAKAIIYERTKVASDEKIFLKCPLCGGLVSHRYDPERYECVDCLSDLKPKDVILHDTVNSWQLFRTYARVIGVDMKENFE